MSDMTVKQAAEIRRFLLRAFNPFGVDVAGMMSNVPHPSLEVSEHETKLAAEEMSDVVSRLPDGMAQHLYDRAAQMSYAVAVAGQNGHPVGARPAAEDYVAFFLSMVKELEERAS